ncbi:Hypothetical predicted protein, partial [Mytilus galloprovincialis]
SCKVGLTTARDCSEVQSQGHDCSGVYTIKPSSTSTVQVWCDQHTDGGRWTVVQRRQDGSVDFDRNWVNYRAGFGAPHTEYWIGDSLINTQQAGCQFSTSDNDNFYEGACTD